MTSRRVRIKGIAIIPPRKKVDDNPDVIKSEKNIKIETSSNRNEEQDERLLKTKNNEISNTNNEANVDGTSEKKTVLEKTVLQIADSDKKEVVKPIPYRRKIKPIIKASNIPRNQQQQHRVIDKTEEIKNNDEIETNLKVTTESYENANLSDGFNKLQNNDLHTPASENFLKPASDINLITNKYKTFNRKDESDSDLEADVIGLRSSIGRAPNSDFSSENKTGFKRARNSLSESGKSGSEVDYPLTPSSPNKILSRGRIKAVPCLTSRRISFSVYGSASESEDESKKNFKRIRNDSVLSSVSCSSEPQSKIENPSNSPTKIKDSNVVVQKKVRRSEHYRKLAEARREFNMKFSKGVPDRQKLTMLDLIFYNPNTKPMSQQKLKKGDDKEEEKQIAITPTNTTTATTSTATTTTNIDTDAENVKNSNPAAPEQSTVIKESYEQENSDEEDVLAPQIKIGPNGEIIVDEQSLVVENKETKKNRENLQNSVVIDGDFDSGFNGYKKNARSKAWTKSETLRFYKALNSIGTDFSLMVELFPNRKRRDLKMKFNKEERMNPTLIDRALTQPIEFNMTDLQLDLKREEKEKEEMTKRSKEANEAKAKARGRPRRTRGGTLAKSLDSDYTKPKRTQKTISKPKTSYAVVQKGIAGVLDTDSEEEEKVDVPDSDEGSREKSDSEKSSTDEDKIDQILIPTRSGRIPKPASRLTYPESHFRTIVKKVPNCAIDKDSIDFSQYEPGSLLILTSDDASGTPAYKVFMLVNGNDVHSVDLNTDMLRSLTNNEVIGSGLSMTEGTIAIDSPQESSVSVSEGSFVLNDNFVQEGTENIVPSLSFNHENIIQEVENVHRAPSIDNENLILPANMSELYDVNLTIAHTSETDMKNDTKCNETEEKNIEERKIVITKNILISPPYNQTFSPDNGKS